MRAETGFFCAAEVAVQVAGGVSAAVTAQPTESLTNMQELNWTLIFILHVHQKLTQSTAILMEWMVQVAEAHGSLLYTRIIIIYFYVFINVIMFSDMKTK